MRNSTSEYLCNESLRYGKEKRQPILAAFDNATIGIYNAVIIMAIQNIRLLFSSNNARQHADAITVLAILLGMAISSISSLKTISFFSFGIDSLIIRFPWETFPLSEIEITFLIMAIIITSSILAWITRVKNRTLWFMLLLLVPLGWIGFIFIRDRNRVYQYGLKYWRGLRQLLCWLGIFLVIAWVIIAMSWDLPMTGSNTIVYRDGFGDIREEEVPAKDYSNAPVLIQLGGQNMFFAIVVGGMLFYGALKK